MSEIRWVRIWECERTSKWVRKRVNEWNTSEWVRVTEWEQMSEWLRSSEWLSEWNASEWVSESDWVCESKWLSGCEWVSGMRVSVTASEWLRASEMSERANAWECERASVSDWERAKWVREQMRENVNERVWVTECVRTSDWVAESEQVSAWNASEWLRASECVRASGWVAESEQVSEYGCEWVSEQMRERAIAREYKRASETDWAAWSKRVSEWNASECECEQMSENENKSVSGMGTSEWARGIEQMSECERVRMQVVTECVWEQVTEWLRANEWVNGMRVSANVSECVRARASKWVSTNASEWMGAIEQISESDRVRMRTSESDWVWESKWLVRG